MLSQFERGEQMTELKLKVIDANGEVEERSFSVPAVIEAHEDGGFVIRYAEHDGKFCCGLFFDAHGTFDGT